MKRLGLQVHFTLALNDIVNVTCIFWRSTVMSTEKLEASEEPQAPLANTSETNSIKGDAENIVTVFDLANEIEKSLKDVQRQMKENDDEFSRSIQAIEDKLNKMSRWEQVSSNMETSNAFIHKKENACYRVTRLQLTTDRAKYVLFYMV